MYLVRVFEHFGVFLLVVLLLCAREYVNFSDYSSSLGPKNIVWAIYANRNTKRE